MINENEEMKKREGRLKKLLGEVLMMVGSGGSSQEIKNAINSTLNEI